MNHFPVDLQLIISIHHTNGKRYYDLLDLLFHLNLEDLPKEAWGQIQLNDEINEYDSLLFINEELSLLYNKGIPFFPLASLISLLSNYPFGAGKKIVFWLNRAVKKDDQVTLINHIAALNNLYAKFNLSDNEKLRESKLDLTYSFSETRKSLRQHFIKSNIERGLERGEAIERSYYQICGISSVFDVVDTFGRRRKF